MAKENIRKNRLDFKVLVFWCSVFIVTAIFAVLFAIRIHDTKIFDSYEDIQSAKLNLVYDITGEEGQYFVYIYSAKENSNGKLVDTNKTDIIKANEVLPTVFNYFNYVRRNERVLGDSETFSKIYGYNAKTARDGVLQELDLELDQLPALVKVNGSIIDGVYTKTSDIQKQLTSLMKK